jgi:hypothetical protein
VRKRILHPRRPKTACYGLTRRQNPPKHPKTLLNHSGRDGFWRFQVAARRSNTAPRPIRAAPTVGAPSGGCGRTTYAVIAPPPWHLGPDCGAFWPRASILPQNLGRNLTRPSYMYTYARARCVSDGDMVPHAALLLAALWLATGSVNTTSWKPRRTDSSVVPLLSGGVVPRRWYHGAPAPLVCKNAGRFVAVSWNPTCECTGNATQSFCGACYNGTSTLSAYTCRKYDNLINFAHLSGGFGAATPGAVTQAIDFGEFSNISVPCAIDPTAPPANLTAGTCSHGERENPVFLGVGTAAQPPGERYLLLDFVAGSPAAGLATSGQWRRV